MRVKTMYSFKDESSTGIDGVPPQSLVQVEHSVANGGKPFYFTLLNKTGITATTAISDILANVSIFYPLGSGEEYIYNAVSNEITVIID